LHDGSLSPVLVNRRKLFCALAGIGAPLRRAGRRLLCADPGLHLIAATPEIGAGGRAASNKKRQRMLS
jgi:hypothetical protein